MLYFLLHYWFVILYSWPVFVMWMQQLDIRMNVGAVYHTEYTELMSAIHSPSVSFFLIVQCVKLWSVLFCLDVLSSCISEYFIRKQVSLKDLASWKMYSLLLQRVGKRDPILTLPTVNVVHCCLSIYTWFVSADSNSFVIVPQCLRIDKKSLQSHTHTKKS